MKSNQLIKIASILIYCIGLKVYAAPFKIGNGGGGIKTPTGNQVYLIDLAEAGLTDFSATPCSIPTFLPQIEQALAKSNFPTERIACKIAEIYTHDKLLAFSLVTFIQSYTWSFTSEDLALTPDLTTSLNVTKDQIVQIANRRFGQIVINTKNWRLMPTEHQAALVIHEGIYSLIKNPNLSSVELYTLARTITGSFYFDLNRMSSLAFKKITVDLPTIHSTTLAPDSGNIYYLPPIWPLVLASDKPLLFAPVFNIYQDFVLKKILVTTTNDGEIDYITLSKKVCGTPFDHSRLITAFTAQHNILMNLSSNSNSSIWDIGLTFSNNITLDINNLCEKQDLRQLELLLEQ